MIRAILIFGGNPGYFLSFQKLLFYPILDRSNATFTSFLVICMLLAFGNFVRGFFVNAHVGMWAPKWRLSRWASSFSFSSLALRRLSWCSRSFWACSSSQTSGQFLRSTLLLISACAAVLMPFLLRQVHRTLLHFISPTVLGKTLLDNLSAACRLPVLAIE